MHKTAVMFYIFSVLLLHCIHQYFNAVHIIGVIGK